eukprot:982363-Amphidinium_carterae.1
MGTPRSGSEHGVDTNVIRSLRASASELQASADRMIIQERTLSIEQSSLRDSESMHAQKVKEKIHEVESNMSEKMRTEFESQLKESHEARWRTVENVAQMRFAAVKRELYEAQKVEQAKFVVVCQQDLERVKRQSEQASQSQMLAVNFKKSMSSKRERERWV